ncbi:hypothetical protein DIPPA_18048 [Diplonema papillatum]|nr:hypothetical protein DIPPA_18048 [Diplonema papillatum]
MDEPKLLPDETSAKEEKRFGQNSYHYFHDHTKERAAVGDVATQPKPRVVGVSEDAPIARRARNIAKYSWADGKKFISVYIDFPGIASMQERVSVTYKKRSFTLTIAADNDDHVLKLIRLNQRIDGGKSTLKFKDDQLVMKIAKEEESKWYDLFKTTLRGVTGSDSDE